MDDSPSEAPTTDSAPSHAPTVALTKRPISLFRPSFGPTRAPSYLITGDAIGSTKSIPSSEILGVVLFSFFLGFVALSTFYYYWRLDYNRKRERLFQAYEYEMQKQRHKIRSQGLDQEVNAESVNNPIAYPPSFKSDRKDRSDSNMELLQNFEEEDERSTIICL